MKKSLLLLLHAALLCGCSLTPKPPTPHPPQPPPTMPARTVQVTVRGSDTPTASLLTDDGRTVPCPMAGGITRALCTLDPATPDGIGAHLTACAPGRLCETVHFAMVDFTKQWLETGSTNQDLLEELVLPPAAPPVERLAMSGRNGLRTPGGTVFVWRGATAFQLVEFMAHGREEEAGRFIDRMKPARVFRVLLMAANLFQLSPGEGLAALPATLAMAKAHGAYLEVTMLADTGSYPGLDYRAMARAVGNACAQYESCAGVEIGNELFSLHQTQDDRLGDVALLKELRDIVRQYGPIPTSLGSTHAGDDESDVFRDGDYLTIHGARGEGDWGDWRWVRHTNEQRALGDRVARYPVNDEPRRDDLACDKHYGLGLLTRLYNIGDTFHYGGGLFAQVPAGGELEAFQCRSRGWAALPEDWSGSYENAGFANSPVKGFVNAVRIYSSVRGSEAYTVVLGAQPGMVIEWSDAWPHRTMIGVEGAAQLWHVTR